MNAVTQLAEEALEETLSRYHIGQLKRYWPAAGGIENSNYFVRTQQGHREHEYVLTIMEQTPHAGQAYVPMMEALGEDGLPVPTPLKNLAGMSIDHVLDKPAVLQRRLPGQHTFNPTAAQIQGLARFIARMHIAMDRSAIELPPHPRQASWLAQCVAQIEGRVAYADWVLARDTSAKIEQLLGREDVKALPSGMVHGDLFRDNVLFSGNDLTGVLDFHHASLSYRIFDLAVAANDWCSDTLGQLNPERTLLMLKTYHKLRPLSPAEIWFFPTFTLYAALTFWLSRLTVAVQQQQGIKLRNKNPDEYRRIVAQHSRHSFYVDERALSV